MSFLQRVVPAAAAESEALARDRAQCRRDVMASLRVLRSQRDRSLVERAMDGNDQSQAQLARVADSLQSVTALVDNLVARYADADLPDHPAAAGGATTARSGGGASSSTAATGRRSASAGAIPRLGDAASAKPTFLRSKAAGASGVGGAAAASSTAPSYQRDVAALEAFVAAHGHSLGWAPADHARFEKVLAATTSADVRPAGAPGSFIAADAQAARAAAAHVLSAFSDDALAQALQPQLPAAYAFMDIVAHVRLYREYVALLENKRVAIAAWKDERRVEQLEADRVASLRQEQKRTEAERAAAQREQARLARLRDSATQVQAWKEAKAAAQQEAALAEADRQRALRQASELQRRMAGAALQARVEANRALTARRQEFHVMAEALHQRQVATTSHATLKQRREQDAAILARRRVRMLSAEARRPQSADGRASLGDGGADAAVRPATSVCAHRYPNRLIAPTASSKARATSSDARVALTRGPMYHTPRTHLGFFRAPAAPTGMQFMR